MIIILDDSFTERHKYSDVSFLTDKKYKNVCLVYERPTMKDFRKIVNNLSNTELLCKHRSLKLYNEDQEVIDGNQAIQNLILQVQSENISTIEFGGDTHSNFKLKTINKPVFYLNLRPFLDNFIENNQIELKILYYGQDYQKVLHVSAFDKMMDEIYFNDSIDFRHNSLIIGGIKMLYSNSDPHVIIDEWLSKGLSKKEIILAINNQISHYG